MTFGFCKYSGINRLKFQTCALLTCLLSFSSGYAVGNTNAETDLVLFFKQAISSPPDIEKYVAKRTNLQLPANRTKGPLQGSSQSRPYGASSFYIEGALSGTNYYLHSLPDPDLPPDSNHLGTISVRSGSSTYQIGGHGIIRGIGENGLLEDVKAKFRLSRQMLGMGAGEIEPETVKWNGNDFLAKNILGKDVYGSLHISNNLPLRLEVSLTNELLPYEAIEYTYATPADTFAGYPAKFIISYKSRNELKPLAEIEFESVLLATQQLGAGFFSETRFADLIRYTNVFSNSDYYVTKGKSNKLVKVDSGGAVSSHSRKIIYFFFTTVILPPIVILLIWVAKKTKNK